MTPTGAIVFPPTIQALADGCTGIVYRAANPAEVGWVPVQESEPAWKAVPPSSGSFSPTPYQGPRVILPESEQKMTFSESVALLYRGWVVMWYSKSAKQVEVESAADYVESLPPDARVVLAPWPSGAPVQGNARPWNYVGWQQAQSCMTFSILTVERFREQNAAERAPGAEVPLGEPGPPALVQ